MITEEEKQRIIKQRGEEIEKEAEEQSRKYWEKYEQKQKLKNERKKIENDNYLIRPVKLNEYIGQDKAKEIISNIINKCKRENTIPPHLLIWGLSGIGKTTFAYVLACELGLIFKIYNGAGINRRASVYEVIQGIDEKDIILIDEIHRLRIDVAEIFYTPMEDYRLDEDFVPPFTLIGTTTIPTKIPRPFLDRFTFKIRLERLFEKDLVKILDMNISKLKLNLESENVLWNIAKVSRGCPRLAVSFLNQLKSFNKNITEDNLKHLLSLLNIDSLGIRQVGRKMLTTLVKKGKMSIRNIAKILGEDESLLQDEDNYLIYLGFLEVNNRYREITEKGLLYLKNYLKNGLKITRKES